MTRVFVYLRVSGRGQIEGDGFDRQLLACQKYAADNDCEIVEVFYEKGVCGETELEDRPALSELFAALQDDGVRTVLIERLDRLARDLMVQETIVADIQKTGYALLSTCEPDLCSKDPSRVLVRQIFGAIAQYEKAMIVLKLRGSRQRKKIKNGIAKGYSTEDAARLGKCEGRHAYGEKPAEVDGLKQIMEWRATGLTVYRIAEGLNTMNIASRSGRPWRGQTVAKIIRRLEAA